MRKGLLLLVVAGAVDVAADSGEEVGDEAEVAGPDDMNDAIEIDGSQGLDETSTGEDSQPTAAPTTYQVQRPDWVTSPPTMV